MSESSDYTTTSSTTSAGTIASNGLEYYGLDQIADYIAYGYWEDSGRNARSWDIELGDTLTVNISGLTQSGQEAARIAFASWTAVSGINFEETTNYAQITIDDLFSGAWASTSVQDEDIVGSYINISNSWSKYGSYYEQTFIHEIGHALGLGHSGDYNSSANYNSDAHYANDSWNISVMSYFSQSQNSQVDASFAYLATPQLGDIEAIRLLYGDATTIATGDTIYGDGESTGQLGMDLTGKYGVALVDNGGTDLIDLSSHTTDTYLSLVAETFSDIGGKTGILSIASGTVIENGSTGSGDDTIIGNDADNMLVGGAGTDFLAGGAGADSLVGGVGADYLTGGAGSDVFAFSTLEDAGDTITDFNVEEGDQINVTSLLQDLGQLVATPFADGILWLQDTAEGVWLYAQDTALAFLEGVYDIADGLSLLDTSDLPEPVVIEEDPDPDTVYVLSDTDVASGLVVIDDSDGGTDTLDLSAITYNVTISLQEVDNNSGLENGTLSVQGANDIENLILGGGDDIGTGNDSDNYISGGAGKNKLLGEGGADTLSGGDGADFINGGNGADEIYGAGSTDYLVGGSGNDLLDGGDGKDTLKGNSGDDEIYGGAGRDVVFAGSGDDIVEGGADADKLSGEDGSDLLYGGTGNDYLYGHNGEDSLFGGVGNDKLYGNNGVDVLDGGDGSDWLNGGSGGDWYTGGDGADTFVLASSDTPVDVFTDFTYSEGDKIHADILLGSHGTDAETAFEDGSLTLEHDANGAWLSLALGENDADTIELAYLENITEDQSLDLDWFV